MTYSSCYTSWGLPTNIVLPSTPIYYSSYFDLNDINFVKNGYNCGECQYFATRFRINTWMRFDLGMETTIEKLLIITAQNGRFEGIELYLSNTADYETGSMWRLYDMKAPYSFGPLTISGNDSVSGRYLTLRKIEGGSLGFCEIQVIPQFP